MSESKDTPGAPPPGGPDHKEHIAAGERQEFKQDHTATGMCGVTLNASVEGNAIASVMADKPGVKITKYPAMIRIDAPDRIEFVMEEIADALGEEDYDTYDFEVETSTHYGRMVRLDDRILLFADPMEAAEYLGGI